MTRIGQLDVFPLNLGGNVFGWTADAPTTYAVLDAFVAGGGNFIDTADSYSAWVPGHTGGESERLIGSWLKGRRRDDVVIATKVSQHPEYKGLSAPNVAKAVDASLERLGTDHIDLYYAHFDDETPMAEIVGAFSTLVDAGKIRHIGISNFSPERIDEWFAVTEADGLHRAVALQPHYSLVERDFETNGLRAAAQRHALAVLPYYALASGFLTGKYRGGADVDSPRAGGAARYADARGDRVLTTLDEVARTHGTSVASVALAWLRQQETVAAPVASASSVAQVPDLLASAGLELDAVELDALRLASEVIS
ncbi:aldo/keto reductase [Nocardioides jishulii]|uniref:Aldo/keto reductase n=1 Tax=Nocardioides jishulii TaxID=2575440 RepID=A0A4U2YMA3_9ACTN|nr:aldo/keto reductase [Nocardioides jishulii]QCX27572.1 aldo/keto reductase [Nocardioides jishulii]TKI62379.1 aldo/keto reductase [Nocardioides jishulii]